MAALPKAFWPLTIAAGVNDVLHVMVGVTAYTATVAPGTYYSPASLAAAVQAALTAAVANAWAVSVSEQGRFTISGTTAFVLSKTSGTNLLPWSQQFDNAAWVKLNATISANATTAPDGTATADKLQEDATAGVPHRATGTPSPALAASTYTKSIYAKAAERTKLQLRFGASLSADYDLVAVTATPKTGAPAVSIEAVGSGWYRCTMQGVASASDPVHIYLRDAAGASAYNGVAGNGLYIWQSQMESGELPGALAVTSGASLTPSTDPLFTSLGFVDNVVAAVSIAAPYQHQNGWYADRPVGFDSKPWFTRTAGQTVALSARARLVTFAEQEMRTIHLSNLPAWKMKVGRESGRIHEALERLWRDGAARFRWWDDATVEGTFVDLVLGEDAIKKFNPTRLATKELYSVQWDLRRYV